MAQPEQKPVAWMSDQDVGFKKSEFGATQRNSMHKSNHRAIRMVLQKYPDGLTLTEIIERIEKDRGAVTRALEQMADTYIDRWKASSNSVWVPVWCVIVPPENCPKPTEKFLDRTRTKPT